MAWSASTERQQALLNLAARQPSRRQQELRDAARAAREVRVQAVLLALEEGCSVDEAAQRVGLSVHAVRRYRAMARARAVASRNDNAGAGSDGILPR